MKAEFIFCCLGALHSNDGTNNSIELEEEIVFKHAIYISNQLKATSPTNQAVNLPSHFSTLLHKLVRLNNLNQIKAIKKSNYFSFHLIFELFFSIEIGAI